MHFYSYFVMSSKWCVCILLLWTIANGPSPVSGSGRGGNVTLTEVETRGNGSRSGLRKSTGSLNDFVILKSSFGGDEEFSKVRRIRRETSTEYLKVKLSSGSYVYRPITALETNYNSTTELTRVPRAEGYKRSKGYPKRKGYQYTTPSTTTPAPIAAETTEENDSFGITPSRPTGVDPNDPRLGRTTTEDPVDIRDAIPGEPGKDYQALASIPKTTFTCEGRAPGFYADVEAGCQVFHRCTDDPWYTGQVRVIMDSFLCPNGSLFNQQIFACDWWGNTDCKGSEEFYELNQQIGQLEETDAGTVQYVKFTGIRVPPAPGTKKVAPSIIPKSERKPLDPKYKTQSKSKEAGSRPLETDDDDEKNIQEFENFGQFSSQIDSEEADERQGSSQTVDEVKEPPIPTTKKSKKKSSKKTTTTTPAPISSEESSSSEETQEPSAATNNNARPLVVNRERDRGESAEAATPAGELEPPNFRGDPVDDGKDGETTTRAPSASTPSSKQDYLPPRDEYLPPKESTGYQYPKPDKEYLPPGDKDYLPPRRGNEYLPPRGEYLSGTSPSTNQYLPPTTQRPGGEYLPPRRDAYAPPGLHTYSPTPDSYYRKPSAGYGNPVKSPYSDYLPPTAPSREYGQPQGRDYLPPSKDYGTPNQQSRDYLPPKNDYLPPNKEYGTPQRGNGEYLPPKNAYLPPRQGYGTPGNDYLPPSKDYGTPNTNKDYLPPQRSNEYLPPKNDYLPPKPTSNEYLPPKKDYLPPSQSNEYLPPSKKDYLPPAPPPSYTYGVPQSGGFTFYPHQTTVTEHWPAKFAFEAPVTPNSLFPLQNYASHYPTSGPGYAFGAHHQGSHFDRTATSYLPPQPTSPSRDFGPPRDYLPPQKPGDSYLPPQKSANDYLPPTKPSDGYLPPQKPSGDYGPPQRPSGDYGPPQRPSGDYGPPQRPSGDYGPPQRPSGDYGPPQRPSGDYGPPQKPSGDYGPPQRPSGDYGPPQKPSGDYGPPQRPSGDYGPPQKPSGDYGPPQKPSGDYGPPQKPSGDYGPPQRPSGDYGPPQKPSGDYGPPQRPTGDYGPPPAGNDYLPPQKPNNDYLPPQKPNNDYLPPQKPNNDYLPPQKPNNDYLPPQRPDKDYLPPQRPNNEYLPPSQDNRGYTQPPAREYGTPTTGGYSTLPDHILQEYNPGPTPPSSYSTIPDQTPPPIYDSGQLSGGGLYAITGPKIDILSVPLVSYSHVVNPIIEFPPFKKR